MSEIDRQKILNALNLFAEQVDFLTYNRDVAAQDFVFLGVCGKKFTPEELMRENVDEHTLTLWSVEELRFVGGGYGCTLIVKFHEVVKGENINTDEVCTCTVVMDKVDQNWLVVRFQRSQGVPVADMKTPKNPNYLPENSDPNSSVLYFQKPPPETKS